jgi:hypothetical protein
MEEDIKILEEMITWDSLLPNKRQTEAIDNLIKGYRELESEIQHKNDQLFLIHTQNERYYEKHCIPKSKIKEKIEELNDYYKKEVYPTKYQWVDIDITEFYDNQIGLLQELMEDK